MTKHEFDALMEQIRQGKSHTKSLEDKLRDIGQAVEGLGKAPTLQDLMAFLKAIKEFVRKE